MYERYILQYMNNDYIYIYSVIWKNNGYYINTRTSYIQSDYLGDWIIIKLPNPIILTKFRFYRNNFNRAPALWRFYGSIDGINWELECEEKCLNFNYWSSPIKIILNEIVSK